MTHTTITSSNSAAVKRVGRCETALISSTGAEEAEALGWEQLFFVAIIAFALGMLAVAIPVGVVAWWVA